MLRGPKGEPIDIHKDNNEDALRGERLNEIRQDLNNGDLDDEEKLLKYSSHLEWFLNKFRTLWKAQEAMQHPGKWNKSLISFGVTNGLVLAMAIFVEEQADPPYRKLPEELDGSSEIEGRTNKILEEKAKAFMINMITQLEAVICIGPSGKPKGYEDNEDRMDAWMKWRNDTINHINESPFEMPEIRAAIERIRDFNKDLVDQQKEAQDEEE